MHLKDVKHALQRRSRTYHMNVIKAIKQHYTTQKNAVGGSNEEIKINLHESPHLQEITSHAFS